MISVEKALSLIEESVGSVEEREQVELVAASGRVTAQDYCSDLDIPLFDKSAMDGYLIMDDSYDRYRVKSVVKAGESGEIELEPAECLQIMTGAPVREGAKRVIMRENVERQGDFIYVQDRGGKDNICRRGEDLQKGERALAEGTLINPYSLGVLASVGVDPVTVYRELKVDILVTGDELVEPAMTPHGGKIRDVNSFTLLSSVNSLPFCRKESYSRIGDSLEATVAEISRFKEGDSDLLLVSGGSSVGDFDYCEAALKEAGFKIIFSKIKVKPGKPVIFAKCGSKIVFGLPGNPVSVLVSFENFVKPALYRMAGSSYRPLERRVALAEEFKRRRGFRTEFVPVELVEDGGRWACRATRYKGSGNITALGNINYLMRIDEGVTTLAKGEQVLLREIGR